MLFKIIINIYIVSVINFFDILRDFIKKSDLLTMVTPLKRVKNRRVKQERYPISINNNFYSENWITMHCLS